jgi:hypothetical protein
MFDVCSAMIKTDMVVGAQLLRHSIIALLHFAPIYCITLLLPQHLGSILCIGLVGVGLHCTGRLIIGESIR